MNPAYQYRAEVLRVVDGDTIDFAVELGFFMTARIRVRLLDVDAPEIRGGSKVAGQIVAEKVREWCDTNNRCVIVTTKTGKYGRWLAEVYPAGGGPQLNQLVRAWTEWVQ